MSLSTNQQTCVIIHSYLRYESDFDLKGVNILPLSKNRSERVIGGLELIRIKVLVMISFSFMVLF